MTNEIKDWKTRPFIDKVNMVRLFETESFAKYNDPAETFSRWLTLANNYTNYYNEEEMSEIKSILPKLRELANHIMAISGSEEFIKQVNIFIDMYWQMETILKSKEEKIFNLFTYDELRKSDKDFEGKDNLRIIISGIEWPISDEEDCGDEDYNPYEDELFNLLYDVPESCYDDEDDDDYEYE